MKDFASCFSQRAVQVSDVICSGHSTSSCISPALLSPSVQTAVVCLYTHSLPSGKHLLVSITWARTALSHSLAVAFNGDASSAFRLSATSRRPFRKPKGSKPLDFQNLSIEIFWDLSSARYGPGPEPIDGFYVFLTVDSEIGPAIGDPAPARRLCPGGRTARSSLISRREHFSGSAACGTRVRFRDAAASHEISIHCDGDNPAPELSVSVDGKTVARVKRLRWNFRGNQTIFLDGLPVDLMWDVHDWLFGPGTAVFMFRTRSGPDGRLWMEEKMVNGDQDKVDFSLIICFCNN